MDILTRWVARPSFMWFFWFLGRVLILVGIVTAAIKVTIADFTPMLWVLLGIACLLGMIALAVLRILTQLESRKAS